MSPKHNWHPMGINYDDVDDDDEEEEDDDDNDDVDCSENIFLGG